MRNVAAALVLLSVIAVGCWRQASPSTATAPTKKVWEREELRKEIIGKESDVVLKSLGKPESTEDSGTSQMWTYRQVSRDPILNTTDALLFVHFERGRVSSVNFSN